MKATLEVGEERLVSQTGTIIPHAVRFEDGTVLATYHQGADASFSEQGASISHDQGQNWKPTTVVNRASAVGKIGPERALLFDQYLWRTGHDRYTVLYAETEDAGKTFQEKTATFHLRGTCDKEYRPRRKEDPDYFNEPDIPEHYRFITERHGAFWGGHLFGHVIRLPDGALGISAYCLMQGNMTRTPQENKYVGQRPDEANALEAREQMLWSSLFFRSEDDGANWHQAGTIGKVTPGNPFDAGMLYSEGFTETDIVPTADGKIYALMRHGSYMLMWWTFSKDGGRNWEEITCHTHPGVAPNLVQLPNRMVAGAWGRPGLTVGISLDGTVQNWDITTTIFDDRTQSQKYPWLVPLTEDRLLLFYDRRKWDIERKKHYEHGIYCRELKVEAQQ